VFEFGRAIIFYAKIRKKHATLELHIAGARIYGILKLIGGEMVAVSLSFIGNASGFNASGMSELVKRHDCNYLNQKVLFRGSCGGLGLC
jgi:hypothetical protein